MKIVDKSREQLISEIEALQKKIFRFEATKRTYKQIIRNISETRHPDPHSMGFMDGAVYVIFDRKYEYINDTFAEIFNVMPEEVCNSGFKPMTLVAPESRQLVLDKYREGLNGESNTLQFGFTGLTKDGLKIDCKTHALFIPYKWGVAMHGMVWNLSALDRFDSRVISLRRQRWQTMDQNSSLFFTTKASGLNMHNESVKNTRREPLKTAYGK